MAERKKNSWKKKLLLAILSMVVVFAIVYWYIATDKFSDTKNRAAAYTLTATDFFREYQKSDSAANQKYREKIIAINGRISQLEAPDTATVNVKFIDPSGDYLIFAFQEQHLSDAKSLKEGDSVSIKASCSGVNYSDILGVRYISFKRAALNK